MSITFSIEDAPTTEEITTCYCLDDYNKPEPDCQSCSGSGEVTFLRSVWPEINLCNRNAHVIQSLLELPEESCGEIPVDTLPRVQRRLVHLLNSKVERRPGVLEGCADGNVFSFGLDDAAVLERLKRFQEVVSAAIVHSRRIIYG